MAKIKFLPILFLIYSCAVSTITLRTAATSSSCNQDNGLLSISQNELKSEKNGDTVRLLIMENGQEGWLRRRKSGKQLWQKAPAERRVNHKVDKLGRYGDMSYKELNYLHRVRNTKNKASISFKDMIPSIAETWIFYLISKLWDCKKKQR